MKKWLWFGAVFALVFVLAACGGNGNNDADNGAAAPTENAGNAGNAETGTGNEGDAGNPGGTDTGTNTTTVAVKAKNWEFSEPEFHIPKGTDVTMSLESTEGIHGIAIRGTDYNIANGASATINIAEAGEYELYCSIPCGTGHAEMKSKLIVE